MRSPFVAVLATLALSGCQRFDRTQECRSLAQVVNPVLAAIDKERKQGPEDANLHRAIGMQYESVAVRVGRIRSKTKKLSDAIDEYQRVLRDAGRDARNFAEALESKNAGRIAATRSEATRTTKREASALSRIDTVCHGR